jgi:two-component system, NarL family, nitrate/nitrite response regulator NarL
MFLAVMEMISVLVVDESPDLAQDMLLALRRRTGVQVLGPVPDEATALDACLDVRPDLVVVQLDRRDERGVSIVSAIRSGSSIRVMTATKHPAAPLVELALAAGACGVLPSALGASSLLNAFRRAIAGELVLPHDGVPVLMDRVRKGRTRMVQIALLATLTGREREVLAALAQGVTMPGIALELGISRATVQTHVKNILGKLEVHSQVEAVGAAWRAGLALSSRSA